MTELGQTQGFTRNEFRHDTPDAFEVDDTGNLVAKDRWRKAMNTIRALVGIHNKEFDMDEVVERVRALVSGDANLAMGGWISIDEVAPDDGDDDSGILIDITDTDGSVMIGGRWHNYTDLIAWPSEFCVGIEDIVLWRPSIKTKTKV